ncbi:phosphopantetheine-binding protein, partial [Kitasatospora sp. NPDC036755]|uniref:phosphopantetheine-binding protein n=1 Tax=Kitasatospora sp. NPDC036755 TaxID=3154600 RepID=UPI0033C169A0
HTTDGVLEYVDRVDRQVKFRGFRVELGEIEAAVAAHPQVARAVVVTRPDGLVEPELVAYCIPAEDDECGARFDVEQVRDHAARLLPDFMLPSWFVPLAHLPLTANGKLDLSALPDPRKADAGAAEPSDGGDPHGEIEELIAQVWAEVLGRERIGADDDFFALGGHSLMALRVVARIKRVLGLSVPTRQVYRHPRLRDLAQHVEFVRRDAGAEG